MMNIRSVAFTAPPESLETAPEAGRLDIEEAVRRLTAMIERDPRVRRIETARRTMRASPRFGPATVGIDN